MARLTEIEPRRQAAAQEGGVGRIAMALLALAVTLVAIWYGFIFLRDNQNTAPKIVTTIVAVIWGIVAAVLYFTGKKEIEEVEGMPQTVDTVKEIPETLKRNEENR